MRLPLADIYQRYTVVATADDGRGDAVGTELSRFSVTVASDETGSGVVYVSESEVDPGSTVQLLLYTGEAPDFPDPDSAHRILRQTVNGTE